MAESGLADIIAMLDDPADRYKGEMVWHHCRDSRHCNGVRGMPDLVIIGRGKVLWAEVKPYRGAHLTADQTTWKYNLIAAGYSYVVWTPADFRDGTVRLDLDSLL